MSYLDKLGQRLDEGLAFLSPHPMRADYILLPRDAKDPHDFHTRICQHAEITIPGMPTVRHSICRLHSRAHL